MGSSSRTEGPKAARRSQLPILFCKQLREVLRYIRSRSRPRVSTSAGRCKKSIASLHFSFCFLCDGGSMWCPYVTKMDNATVFPYVIKVIIATVLLPLPVNYWWQLAALSCSAVCVGPYQPLSCPFKHVSGSSDAIGAAQSVQPSVHCSNTLDKQW